MALFQGLRSIDGPQFPHHSSARYSICDFPQLGLPSIFSLQSMKAEIACTRWTDPRLNFQAEPDTRDLAGH